MANELPINIILAGALPGGFRGTPQQIAEAITERLRLQSTQSFALLAAGSTEPSSNVGPWLKDDETLYVWDDDLGAYRPQTLEAESVPVNSVGTAQLQDGSVTDAKLAVSAKSPFRATTAATSQALAITAATFSFEDLQFPSENFDGNDAYNPTTSEFTAAVSGYYFVSFFCQFVNSVSDPSPTPENMQIGVEVFDPATTAWLGIGATMNYGRATAGIWFVGTSGLVFMNAGQKAKLRAYAIDGTGGNSLDVSNLCHWSMYLVQQLLA